MAGCATKGITPGQLSLRAIEVRPIDAPYDTAYRAATHAIFALGLKIEHTDKASGIITATRDEENPGKKFAMVLAFGVIGALTDTDTHIHVTMFLSPAGDKETKLRIGISQNDEIVTDQTTIDRIWVLTQREALIEIGEQVPTELEEKAKRIMAGEEESEEESSEVSDEDQEKDFD